MIVLITRLSAHEEVQSLVDDLFPKEEVVEVPTIIQQEKIIKQIAEVPNPMTQEEIVEVPNPMTQEEIVHMQMTCLPVAPKTRVFLHTFRTGASIHGV